MSEPVSDAELMVSARGVTKRFGALEVLKGIDMDVVRGQVAVLIGPSGSGKSTFLRCINHLEQVSAGRLYVDEELVGYRERGGKLHELPPKEAARQRRDVGMVFQHFNLFPHRTALENIVEAPVHVKGVKRDAAVKRARDLLDQVCGVEVPHDVDLHLDRQLLHISGILQAIGYAQRQAQGLLGQHLVKGVLVDTDGLAIFEFAWVRALGKIPQHQQLQRQFDVFLSATDGGFEGNVDAFLWGYRTVFGHGAFPF